MKELAIHSVLFFSAWFRGLFHRARENQDPLPSLQGAGSYLQVHQAHFLPHICHRVRYPSHLRMGTDQWDHCVLSGVDLGASSTSLHCAYILHCTGCYDTSASFALPAGRCASTHIQAVSNKGRHRWQPGEKTNWPRTHCLMLHFELKLCIM